MIQKGILEKAPLIAIETEDFSDKADSTILVRDRMCRTKLEGAYRKVKGKVVGQSEHKVSESQCSKSWQKPTEVQHSKNPKKRTHAWRMLEKSKTPKLSEIQKELHNEDNQVETMQLQQLQVFSKYINCKTSSKN